MYLPLILALLKSALLFIGPGGVTLDSRLFSCAPDNLPSLFQSSFLKTIPISVMDSEMGRDRGPSPLIT